MLHLPGPRHTSHPPSPRSGDTSKAVRQSVPSFSGRAAARQTSRRQPPETSPPSELSALRNEKRGNGDREKKRSNRAAEPGEVCERNEHPSRSRKTPVVGGVDYLKNAPHETIPSAHPPIHLSIHPSALPRFLFSLPSLELVPPQLVPSQSLGFSAKKHSQIAMHNEA